MENETNIRTGTTGDKQAIEGTGTDTGIGAKETTGIKEDSEALNDACKVITALSQMEGSAYQYRKLTEKRFKIMDNCLDIIDNVITKRYVQ